MGRKKVNCWEYMQCGREFGGRCSVELGYCPATDFDPATDGLNGGDRAGRIC